MNLTLLFNSSLDFYRLFSQSSSWVTGSDTLTIFIFLAMLILVTLVFRMPEILIVVVLLPLTIVFAIADPWFRPVVGIMIIIAGMGLFALFKR